MDKLTIIINDKSKPEKNWVKQKNVRHKKQTRNKNGSKHLTIS